MKDIITNIDIDNIDDFPNHSFKINRELNYKELELSILENGILVPAIVRKKITENMNDIWS